MSTPPRALWAGLVDDAAMFPPGNASPDDALAAHLRYRQSWFADLVGPLLVPVAAWEDFSVASHRAGDPPVRVVLIGTTDLPDAVPTGVQLVGFETRVDDVPVPDTPVGLALAAEIDAGPAGRRVLAEVASQAAAGRRIVAKYRTGGTTADAFPSEGQLAAVLRAAVEADAPFKLTAGLHGATRFTDTATGFEHHGFLNVLVAVGRAAAGQDERAVADSLAERDEAAIVHELEQVDEGRAKDLRARFVSFGCCGVEDPVRDLVRLGLLQPTQEAR